MKYLIPIIFSSVFFFNTQPTPSTTSVVTLVGAVIMSEHHVPDKVKYKRADCPVCKGKGWYISGDKIKKIECDYCEP